MPRPITSPNLTGITDPKTGKKRRGPPYALTPAVADAIVELLRAGNYYCTACAKAGVTPHTFIRWRRLAEEGKQPFADFWLRCCQAEAEAEAKALDIVITSAFTSWQAAAWYLERKYPDRWSLRNRIEVSGPQGGPVILQDITTFLAEGFDCTDSEGQGATRSLEGSGSVRRGLPAAEVVESSSGDPESVR